MNAGSGVVNVRGANVLDEVPNFEGVFTEPSVTLRLEDELMLVSGDSDDEESLMSHDFGEEVMGSNSYAVGMWTRWLTTYPTRILGKEDSHSIFRLADRL